MNDIKYLSAGIVGLCLLAPSAKADLTDYKYAFPENTVQNYDISYSGLNVFNVKKPSDASFAGVNAGKLTARLPDNVTTFGTVCLDVGNFLTVGDNQKFAKVSGENLVGINPDWGNPVTEESAKAAVRQAAWVAKNFLSDATIDKNAATSWQALQLTVWETLYDTPAGVNFADKRFQLRTTDTAYKDTAVKGIAEKLLVYAQASVPAALQFSILVPINVNDYKDVTLGGTTTRYYSGADHQELMFDFGSITVVPEPTTVLAGALLLVPFGVSTLRLLRRKPAVEA